MIFWPKTWTWKLLNIQFEAKLWILSEFRNRPKNHFRRNPQIASRIRKFLTESAKVRWIHLHLRNLIQRPIFAHCGFRNKTNVSTKVTSWLFIPGIYHNFFSGIRLHFGTCLKMCLWNPRTCGQKFMRLPSEQVGLVMFSLCHDMHCSKLASLNKCSMTNQGHVTSSYIKWTIEILSICNNIEVARHQKINLKMHCLIVRRMTHQGHAAFSCMS